MIKAKSPGVNFFLLHSLYHRATGLSDMTAIIEFALPEVRVKFDEPPGQAFFCNMIQSKFLESGRVDDSAIVIKGIKLRMRGRVAAGIQC